MVVVKAQKIGNNINDFIIEIVSIWVYQIKLVTNCISMIKCL